LPIEPVSVKRMKTLSASSLRALRRAQGPLVQAAAVACGPRSARGAVAVAAGAVARTARRAAIVRIDLMAADREGSPFPKPWRRFVFPF
jgi:hypothetical protein